MVGTVEEHCEGGEMEKGSVDLALLFLEKLHRDTLSFWETNFLVFFIYSDVLELSEIAL